MEHVIMNKNRTIIYCRESRDDYGLDYERIETQRDLLIRYCKENNLKVVDIIMDDDESGTNFDRYNEIKKRVLQKEFDIILFKNSARLGRNQKESLIFVEFLEEHGIEIRFEDERYDEESFGLYAWFNERRARDDSKNIRRNLREKIKQGKLIIRPIYGYEISNKRLVINEKTAEVVRLIFELYVKNRWGYSRIAQYLTKQGYRTPFEEKRNVLQHNSWKVQNIKRIIKDIRYAGYYLGGMTEKISFKSKRTRIKPEEEWVIIPNMHESIITKDIWDKAQKINEKRNLDIRPLNKEDNILFGLLYCGKCGEPMYRRRSKTRKDVYICRKYFREGKTAENGKGCISHTVQFQKIQNILIESINKIFDNKDIKQYLLENINISSNKNNIKNLKSQLIKLKVKLKQTYNDRLNNLIPEYLFVEKSRELQDDISKIENDISRIEKEQNLVEETSKENMIFDTIEELKNNGFNKEELIKLFNKIIVFNKEDINENYKKEYQLSERLYKDILAKGAIVIHCNFII